MSEAPIAFYDAKEYFKRKDAYPSPYNFILTRYSSPYRIIATTTVSTTVGALFGLSWALFKDQPKFKYFFRCGFGTLGLSFMYSVLNEIANGFVKQNYGKEQFFVNNLSAAIPTIGVLHFFQVIVQAVPPPVSMKRSLKYIGLMGFFNMVNEVLIIKQRDYFLQRNYKLNIGVKGIHETKEKEVPEKNEGDEVKEVKFKASNFKDIKKMFEEKKKEEEAKKVQEKK